MLKCTRDNKFIHKYQGGFVSQEVYPIGRVKSRSINKLAFFLHNMRMHIPGSLLRAGGRRVSKQ